MIDYRPRLCELSIEFVDGTADSKFHQFDEAIMLFAEAITALGWFPKDVKTVRLREPVGKNERWKTTLKYDIN